MPVYCVYSPEMSVIVPVCDDGSGPTEEERSVCIVEARTKKEAIKASVTNLDMLMWVDNARSDGRNPFIGLKADRIELEPAEDS